MSQAEKNNEAFLNSIDELQKFLKRSSDEELDNLIREIIAETPSETEEGLRSFFSKVYMRK